MPSSSSSSEENLLDFDTAMTDFRLMFPSKGEAEIERILRKHDGDVAMTIEELLHGQPHAVPHGHAQETPRRVVNRPEHLPSSSTSSPAPPSYEEAIHSPTSPPANISMRSMTSSTRRSMTSSTRHQRYSMDDYLREKKRLDALKRENEKRLEVVTDEQQARLLEDEQMALLIQHRELTRVFSSSTDPHNTPRRRSARSASYHVPQATSCGAPSARRSTGPRVPDGPVVDDVIIGSNDKQLKEKIKKISKASKERIIQWTSHFRREDNQTC